MMSWIGAYLRRRNQQRILRNDSRRWAAAQARHKQACLDCRDKT